MRIKNIAVLFLLFNLAGCSSLITSKEPTPAPGYSERIVYRSLMDKPISSMDAGYSANISNGGSEQQTVQDSPRSSDCTSQCSQRADVSSERAATSAPAVVKSDVQRMTGVYCQVEPGSLITNLEEIASKNKEKLFWLADGDFDVVVKADIAASSYSECIDLIVSSFQVEGAPIQAIKRDNAMLIKGR